MNGPGDKTFGLGVVGIGARGYTMIADQFVRRQGLSVTALYDPDELNVARAARLLAGGTRVHEEYESLLSDSSVHCVFIASPDWLHEEQAAAAFEAGKHVFSEKPLSLTPEGCLRVLRAQRKSGKLLLLGFVLRYAPLYRKAKELIDLGEIGVVKVAWVLHSVASGSQWYFHDWHSERKNTGSLLLQKGCHDFDILNWMLASQPIRVSAFARRHYFGGDKSDDLRCPTCPERSACAEFQVIEMQPLCAFRKSIDVWDDHVVNLEYENGCLASYNECHFTPDDNREYAFVGTAGKLTLNDAEGTVTLQRRGSDTREVFRVGSSVAGHGGGDSGITEELVRCLRTGAPPSADGYAGYLSILAATGAEESIQKGNAVELRALSLEQVFE